MNNIQIGCFIAECRKEKQITQQELADRLNITNRAVSKWETGKGLPDITLLTKLADILELSVDEILKAKRNDGDKPVIEPIPKERTMEKLRDPQNITTDIMINYLMNKAMTKYKLMAMISILLSLAGVVIQYFIWRETKNVTGWLFGCWLQICGAGIFYYYRIITRNQMADYDNTVEKKWDTDDLDVPYLKILKMSWIIMLLTLILYMI